ATCRRCCGTAGSRWKSAADAWPACARPSSTCSGPQTAAVGRVVANACADPHWRKAKQGRANRRAIPARVPRLPDNAGMTTLRIATRKSPLALWQSEHVAAALRTSHPGLQVELVPMSTRGDEVLDRSLAAIGGKG